jgi:uncharacterized protein YndB with AHSA1/START domain
VVEVSITVPVDREHVFGVLADGWWYATWVVGATHIRDVDPQWPLPGSRIHHSIGAWPLVMHDVTSVRAVEPPRLLELEANLRPFGLAHIRMELRSPEPEVTEIRMAERAAGGPARLLPDVVQAGLLAPRNRESLRRLSALVIGRDAATSSHRPGVLD